MIIEYEFHGNGTRSISLPGDMQFASIAEHVAEIEMMRPGSDLADPGAWPLPVLIRAYGYTGEYSVSMEYDPDEPMEATPTFTATQT